MNFNNISNKKLNIKENIITTDKLLQKEEIGTIDKSFKIEIKGNNIQININKNNINSPKSKQKQKEILQKQKKITKIFLMIFYQVKNQKKIQNIHHKMITKNKNLQL